MKTLLLLGLAVVPLACFSQKTKKTGWEGENLQGKVRTVRSCSEFGDSFDALREKVFSDKSYWTDTFSNTGRCVRKYRIGEGKLTWRTELQYDAKGNLTKETTYNDSGKVTGYNVYKYDAAGNQVEAKIYRKGELSTWGRYRYANGLMTEHEDSSGILGKRKMVYKYASNKKPAEVQHFNGPELKPDGVNKYLYDEKGNRTELASYDKGGKLEQKITYKYDEHNNEILEEHYDSEGRLKSSFGTEYMYDSAGNITKEIKDSGFSKWLTLREYTYY